MIRAILGGELRQGALDGVMAAAVAKAAGVPLAEVQRGCDVRRLALRRPPAVALTAGSDGLDGDRAHAHPPGAADARLTGSQRRRCARRNRAGVGRVEARRRPHPGPSHGRRRPALHPQPQRRHRPPRRCRRRRARRSPAATSCSTARCSASTTPARPRRFQDTMGDFGADAAGIGRRPRPRPAGVLLRRPPRRHERRRRAAGDPTRDPRRNRARSQPAARRSSPPTPTRPSASSNGRSPPVTRA